ncbi:MAG: ATP-binding cassette domain-containing protein [Alphaproteobacteria bacterium]
MPDRAPRDRGPALLSARLLRKRWLTGPGRTFAVEAADIALHPGSHVALVGPSGSGKSTVLDMLALALAPDEADGFAIGGAEAACDVGRLWRAGDSDGLAALRRDRLGYVLQTGGLLPFLNVRDNIALPLRLAGRGDGDAVAELAERLGIAGRLDLRPAALSVGERQRAAIARALVHAPAIVVADEPTASVDQANAERIFALFAELIDQTGVAAVVATHDRGLAEAFGLTVVEHDLVETGDGALSRFRMDPA